MDSSSNGVDASRSSLVLSVYVSIYSNITQEIALHLLPTTFSVLSVKSTMVESTKAFLQQNPLIEEHDLMT